MRCGTNPLSDSNDIAVAPTRAALSPEAQQPGWRMHAYAHVHQELYMSMSHVLDHTKSYDIS